MLENIKKAKIADLDAELDLYRKATAPGDVAAAETLTNRDKRVAEIERLQKEHGFPVELTAEFIAENAMLAKILLDGGAKEGEIVFAEEADMEQVRSIEEEVAKRAEILTELEALKAVDGNEGELTTEELVAKLEKAKAAAPGASEPQETAPSDEANADLVYQHHQDDGAAVGTPVTVVRVDNVLLGGKTYKEIALANGESRRMSQEEYSRDVTPRT